MGASNAVVSIEEDSIVAASTEEHMDKEDEENATISTLS
jgi:hypothetical protein